MSLNAVCLPATCNYVSTAIRTHHTFPALLQPRFNIEELSGKCQNKCFFEEHCALFILNPVKPDI